MELEEQTIRCYHAYSEKISEPKTEVFCCGAPDDKCEQSIEYKLGDKQIYVCRQAQES